MSHMSRFVTPCNVLSRFEATCHGNRFYRAFLSRSVTRDKPDFPLSDCVISNLGKIGQKPKCHTLIKNVCTSRPFKARPSGR
jgi:hypothetical protein